MQLYNIQLYNYRITNYKTMTNLGYFIQLLIFHVFKIKIKALKL
jgi:hypothetical protein